MIERSKPRPTRYGRLPVYLPTYSRRHSDWPFSTAGLDGWLAFVALQVCRNRTVHKTLGLVSDPPLDPITYVSTKVLLGGHSETVNHGFLSHSVPFEKRNRCPTGLGSNSIVIVLILIVIFIHIIRLG